MTDDLTGETLRGPDGLAWRVKAHHYEADELEVYRLGETRAITMMDVAEGRYEVIEPDGSP